MLPLGHLGVGSRLVSPWTRPLPKWPVYLGALLPDLIDKPAYYLTSAVTGRHGLELGLLSGTRTFGHTLLLILSVGLVGKRLGSPVLKALFLGMVSHIVLDTAMDGLGVLFGPPPTGGHSIPGIAAVFWPLLGFQFPVATATSLGAYATLSLNWFNVAGEVVGGLLLLQSLAAFRRRNRPTTD